MTATTSTAKKSFFGVHFRNKLKENKKLLIVNLVLELIGLPLIAVCIIVEEYLIDSGKYMNVNFDIEALIFVACIAVVISLLSGIVIALFSFRYLFTKSLVDMTYSLPLTSKQRFFADYLSGLAIYTVPAIIGAVLSLIILRTGSAFVDLGDFWDFFPYLIPAGFIVFVGMILLYTFTVLSTVCCGSTFEAVFGMLAANITLPATVCTVFNLIQNQSNYSLPNSTLMSNLFLTSASPAGIFVAMANYVENLNFVGSDFSNKIFFRWLIPTLIVIALYLGLSYLLYVRRKAEQVSKPYVYKMFYHIIITLATFCVLSLFLESDGAVVAGIVICAILFFILEIITKRGFKRFWESVLRFTVCVVLVISFDKICRSTNGFGVSKYVPREAAVSSVCVDMYTLNGGSNILIEDKDFIRETIALHKAVIARNEVNGTDYFKYMSDEYSVNSGSDPKLYIRSDYIDLTITYYMKNGTTVAREYNVYPDEIGGLLTAAALNNASAKEKSEQMAIRAFNAYSINEWYSELSKVPKELHASLKVYDKLLNESQQKNITYDNMIKLMEAYKADLTAMTEEEFKTAGTYGYLMYDLYEIKDTFTNTIETLKGLGFEEITVDSSYFEDMYKPKMLVNVFTDAEVYSYGGNDCTYRYVKFEKYSTSPYNIFVSLEKGAQITDEESLDLLITLIDRSVSNVIDSSAAGAVVIYTENGSITLFLPDTAENKDLLKKARKMYVDDKELVPTESLYDYGA